MRSIRGVGGGEHCVARWAQEKDAFLPSHLHRVLITHELVVEFVHDLVSPPEKFLALNTTDRALRQGAMGKRARGSNCFHTMKRMEKPRSDHGTNPKSDMPQNVHTNQISDKLQRVRLLACERSIMDGGFFPENLEQSQRVHCRKTKKPKFDNARKCENGFADSRLLVFASVPRSLSLSHTQSK